MDFGALVGLSQIGLGLFGAFKARQQSQQQQSFYNEQASINRALGAFNAEVALRTGEETVEGIALMTRKLLGQQRAAFAGRGISLEGSPMMLLGETITMGSKQAQQAYFNSEVQAVNARYNAITSVSKNENAADFAKFNALTNTINMAKQLMSLNTIDQYQKSTGVSPNFNIFKWISS
jgi:hypothetical protein